MPASQSEPERKKRPGLLGRLGRSLLRSREASIVIAGLILVIYFQSTASAFLSPGNISNLAAYAATTAIIAAGEVLVVICGEIDLSVGQVYALAPFVMFYAHEAGVPYVLAIVLGMAVGIVVGLINGIVTVLLRIPSFITTLGTLFIINGFTLTISGGFPVQPQANPFIVAIFGGTPFFAIALGYWSNRFCSSSSWSRRAGDCIRWPRAAICLAPPRSASKSPASRLETL